MHTKRTWGVGGEYCDWTQQPGNTWIRCIGECFTVVTGCCVIPEDFVVLTVDFDICFIYLKVCENKINYIFHSHSVFQDEFSHTSKRR